MDPFSVLEILPTMNEKAIKKAYRKLALKLHPDKNNTKSEDFQALHDAYSLLLSPADREMYMEKALKESKISENLKKLRTDLLMREKHIQTPVPHKRQRSEHETPTISKLGGIKLTWKSSSAYTESILQQIFIVYGQISRVFISSHKASIIFINEFACDRAIANPPAQFRLKRLSQEKCQTLLKQPEVKQESSLDLRDKLAQLRAKLSEKSD